MIDIGKVNIHDFISNFGEPISPTRAFRRKCNTFFVFYDASDEDVIIFSFANSKTKTKLKDLRVGKREKLSDNHNTFKFICVYDQYHKDGRIIVNKCF